MKGLLIAIEGINGSGKSTIITELTKYFRNIRQPYKVYKFPDRQGYYGTQIDKFLRKEQDFEYKYDMFNAFAANRLAVRDQMLRDMHDGVIVICDRYIFSGIAYHIPINASDQSIQNYQNIIGYFDKDMPIPDMTYLISGNHLHLRKEDEQRFHGVNANKLFNIFKKIIAHKTNNYMMLRNEYGKIHELVQFMVNDIISKQ